MTQDDCECDFPDYNGVSSSERSIRIKYRTVDAIGYQIYKARNYLNLALYEEINRNTGVIGFCRRVWRNRVLRIISAIVMLFPTMWLLLILGVYIGTQLCPSYPFVLSSNEQLAIY